MSTEIIGYIALGAIILLFAFMLYWLVQIEKRLKKFFAGARAKSLEESFVSYMKRVENLEEEKKRLEKEIEILHKKAKESIRGVETLRFNPFADAGSNQSFAIALLNENKDGVVLSSLYSRERMSVFAKPVKNGDSSYELTKEEKEVLKKAII